MSDSSRGVYPYITPEKCEEQGGHCFARTGFVTASIPPMYEEQCRHCLKRRRAIPREPFTYEEY